jgi:hypothetical protein
MGCEVLLRNCDRARTKDRPLETPGHRAVPHLCSRLLTAAHALDNDERE